MDLVQSSSFGNSFRETNMKLPFVSTTNPEQWHKLFLIFRTSWVAKVDKLANPEKGSLIETICEWINSVPKKVLVGDDDCCNGYGIHVQVSRSVIRIVFRQMVPASLNN